MLPTEDDINVHGSLDELAARDHFLGKSVDEAEELFRDNSAHYQEDLMWMGPRAFQFYLPAVLNYLRSSDSAGDDHVISCLYKIVVFRAGQDGFSLAVGRVQELVDYVIDSYPKFEVDRDVYGDLLGKYQALKIKLADSS